jgi:hypothetical protein
METGMDAKLTSTSTATISLEVSRNGIDWRAIKDMMEMQRSVYPTEIMIAPGMMPEFNIRLEAGGVISETHRLNTFKLSGVPVTEHPYLLGKYGAMRYSNGDVVPFFWGETA